METAEPEMKPAPEILAYYEQFAEETRLSSGASRLEFERTKEVLVRVLPAPPARVIDVGGAAGAYSAWLAERGYEVHLVDASARLVAEARRRAANHPGIGSISLADARSLPQSDGSADAVLLLGPLYHLPMASERAAALREAHRVTTRSGVVVVAAISRYASALDGLARKLARDPDFARIRDRDLIDGQHRNHSGHLEYFTTAYFHLPEELRHEIEQAGFQDARVLGVEGPGWLFADFDERWADPALRQDLLDIARALELEPSILGVSAHLLGIAWKSASAGLVDVSGNRVVS